MAGAGKKTFTVGEVLTASDVNGYLMDQAVMRFADSGARGSAIGTATEGMVSYLDDTDSVEVYDGSAWTQVGGLVAVKHALKTDTQVESSVAAGADVAVTGLSITHAMKQATNKLIISAFFGTSGSSSGRGTVGIAVKDGATFINIADAASNRNLTTAGGYVQAPATDGAITAMPSFTNVYAPGDTASHTYAVHAINLVGSALNLYINRAQTDSDTNAWMRGVSGLVIQEVAV